MREPAWKPGVGDAESHQLRRFGKLTTSEAGYGKPLLERAKTVRTSPAIASAFCTIIFFRDANCNFLAP